MKSYIKNCIKTHQNSNNYSFITLEGPDYGKLDVSGRKKRCNWMRKLVQIFFAFLTHAMLYLMCKASFLVLKES